MPEADDDDFVARNYQTELMKIALQQNTIIYLPTGSGKTFIAIMVLKSMSESLLKSYDNGGKISFILVNTIALVPQHAKYIKDHTILSVGCYTGEMKLDNMKGEEWHCEFNKYQVFIMTSQILLNIINSNFIDLSRVNLIIFDECHRGVDDHSMRQIMKAFQSYPTDKQPRVLGLTATLLNGNCKLHQVMTEVKALETTYHSKVATVDGLEVVVGYSTNPKELFKVHKPNMHCTTSLFVIKELKEVIEILKKLNLAPSGNPIQAIENLVPLDLDDILRKLRNLVQDLIEHTETLGVFGGYIACLAHMVQVERIRKHCQDMDMFITLNYVMTSLGFAKESFWKAMEGYSPQDKIYKFSSDKVLKLFEILEEYKSKSKEELCALIFVKRRFTAKVVHHIIKSLREVKSDLNYIQSNFVVGNSNNPYNDTRECLYITKKNKEVIDSFINKEINVLVSSNVLEEGVDIPKCTLVVKFDKYEDYRSYIQSKGRARHQASLYYTIVEESQTKKFFTKYEEFQQVEGVLNDFLIGKNSERTSPSASEIEDMYFEDLLPPYFVNGPNSAQVNMTSAISLLSRYCLSLPSDSYTVYTPDWYMEKQMVNEKAKIRVVIFLPVVCPIVEPIKGPFMHNKKNAKRAAALYACIQLHKCGELDDSLLPQKQDFIEADLSSLFEHWPEVKESDAGNKKKKRLHQKQVADCVTGPLKSNKELYLHVVTLNPLYQRSEDYNQGIIYDLYTTSLCYGLISPKPLPRVCTFPLYDSNGTVEVELKANAAAVTLTKEQLFELKEFHFLIFNDLLEILKPFLMFDNDGCQSEMLLVVPIDVEGGKVNINFDVVSQHKELKNRIEPSACDRMNIEVNEEDYLHKIVSPWYRTQPSMYIVTRVFIDKSPLTSFPNNDYSDFVSYYEDKHSLKIMNVKQPLLLVKGLSQRLNMYRPRGREGKRKKEKRYEELEEYLIPELVIKQDFPAALWVQARFLPTILSRVTYLLKLEQLQKTVARDLSLNLKYLDNCPPLELDEHLLNFEPYEVKIPKLADQPVNYVNTTLLPLEASSIVTPNYNKDFAVKMLEAEYPWRNIDEPKDVERALNLTVMDIEHYEVFISQKVSKDVKLLKNESPSKAKALPAITYPKEFEEKSLGILSVEFTDQSPNLCELYRALTAAEANDIVNLERLETLGDSFLKLIASLYIAFKFPNYNEGKSTTLKGKLVSNKNLYYLAKNKNLGGILKNSDFSPKDEWTPPCFTVPQAVQQKINRKENSVNSLFYCNIQPDEQIAGLLGKATISELNGQDHPIAEDEENSYTTMCHFLNKQYVSDKTVADSVEALLGAYFQCGGFVGGIKFVEWIGIIPASEKLQTLLNLPVPNPVLDQNSTTANVNFHLPQWQELEKRLGYHFNNRAFLLQALTHSSYSPNRITRSYERLEFLGDAILDFLITCYIYEYCGYLSPGQVTDLRSALVNNNTFASLVVRSGFHKFLLMINSQLQSHVDKFAQFLEAKDYVIDDEVLILVEEQDLNIAEYVDVPKVLGDIFESLAGAVYLDSGKDLMTVWKVFYKMMWREIDLFSKNVPINVLRKLYECHTAYPAFSKPHEAGNNRVMVALEFMCEGRITRVHGFGSNKIMAKRAAAKIALRSLKL